jgi:hypothetical protein
MMTCKPWFTVFAGALQILGPIGKVYRVKDTKFNREEAFKMCLKLSLTIRNGSPISSARRRYRVAEMPKTCTPLIARPLQEFQV